MWKANKRGIITLVLGLGVLGGLHYLLSPTHEQLADQLLALGFCLLVFGVALSSWLSVKPPAEEETEEEAPRDKEA